MRFVSNEIKYDFKDVLIVPQRSKLASRQDVNIIRKYTFKNTPKVLEGTGIIAANMDTIGTFKMAKELMKHRCFTALHKYYDKPEEVVDFYKENPSAYDYVFYTIGASENDFKKLLALVDHFGYSGMKIPSMFCLDAANAYTELFVHYLSKLRNTFPESIIMAGNVCTGNMTEELIMRGANIVKVGIGGGSACLTRVKAAIGYPQLSAIDECSYSAHGVGGHTCSDGGCVVSGDICKALAAGGDFVMIGGMLAGTSCCAGEIMEKEDGRYFKYYGMSSLEANQKYNGGLKEYRAAEGKCVWVKYKGETSEVILDILGGIRSVCTYVGASNVKDLPKCASFVKTNVQENRIFN